MKRQEDARKNFEDVVATEEKRFTEKFRNPTSEWITKVKKDLGKGMDHDVSDAPVSTLLKQAYGHPRRSIRPLDIFNSLNIGDAVELSVALNLNVMAIILEVPSSDDDPRYTIMDRKGELHFVEKSAFKLRIPGFIPEGWVKNTVEKTKYDSTLYGSIKTTVDHKFESYVVNPLARRLIMDSALRVTNEAWNKLPEISRKLEILHRIVQDRGPKQISLFSLVKAVDDIDPEAFKGNLKQDKNFAQGEYLKLSALLNEKLGPEYTLHRKSHLGKEIGRLNSTAKYEISQLYAVILALRKQDRLWSTSYSSRTAMMPTSVTVDSLEYANRIDEAVQTLKKNTSLTREFMSYVENENYSKIPSNFENILNLLKEYSVGNVTDAVSETVICQLMKNMKNIEKVNITRTHVYDLLLKMGYISSTSTNPQHFSHSISIPEKGTSIKADQEQDYYDLATVSKDAIPDISASIRKDFSNMRVYCIDSANAHEIDDGVSIERIDENNVVLHIHIADPSSYLKPEDTISKIAFERAFTAYQPEFASPMLPKSFTDLCGLGVDGRKTRTLTFSVPFNFSTGANLGDAKIQPSYCSKFTSITYDEVDEMLKTTKGQADDTLNEIQRDLNNLFLVAEKLHKSRVERGAIAFGEALQSQVSVIDKEKEKENTVLIDSSLDEVNEVVFSRQKLSNSVTLVSELMILANTAGGVVMKKHQIPGIYKGMRNLKLNGSAATLVGRLNTYIKRTGNFPDLAQIVKAIKFINPAFYFPLPIKHSMLGTQGYLPSTSPLRRFGDLINHWQFHSHLNTGKALFDLDQMVYMSLHIETKNDILKVAQRHSTTFYTMSHIKREIKMGIPTKLSFMVWSRPHDNHVGGMITEYGIFATLNLNLNKRPPKIGEVITDFDIEEMDPVGGMMFIQQR